MNIDGDDEPQYFAAFEAQALAGDVAPADEGDKEPEPKPDADADEPEGDEPDTDEPEGDDDAEPEKEGKRSKPASKRIAELTAKLRQAELDLESERAGRAQPKPDEGSAPPELKAPDPNDDKYEFGEADPKFIADNVRYELKLEQAEEAKARDEAARKEQAAEVGQKLDSDWNTMRERGAEKHDDFAEKVDALQVSEPLLAVAIQASPVGDDAAYYLATNPHEAELIQAQIAAGDVIGAAKAFGEIEGASLVEAPVRPTNGNPLDLALYAGRLKAFKSKEAKPKGKLATDAPEPPSQRVRGASGQFEPDWSDENADLSKLGKLLG
jgi:hypothetical protein